MGFFPGSSQLPSEMDYVSTNGSPLFPNSSKAIITSLTRRKELNLYLKREMRFPLFWVPREDSYKLSLESYQWKLSMRYFLLPGKYFQAILPSVADVMATPLAEQVLRHMLYLIMAF